MMHLPRKRLPDEKRTITIRAIDGHGLGIRAAPNPLPSGGTYVLLQIDPTRRNPRGTLV